jgi:hypothetical protein
MERTIEEIGHSNIYTNVFSEVVCDNPRIRKRETEYVSEDDDSLGPLCGFTRC